MMNIRIDKIEINIFLSGEKIQQPKDEPHEEAEYPVEDIQDEPGEEDMVDMGDGPEDNEDPRDDGPEDYDLDDEPVEMRRGRISNDLKQQVFDERQEMYNSGEQEGSMDKLSKKYRINKLRLFKIIKLKMRGGKQDEEPEDIEDIEGIEY